MAGALVGFLVDGHYKMLRLHGERSCAGVLEQIRRLLAQIGNIELDVLARSIRPVRLFDRPAALTSQTLAALGRTAEDHDRLPSTWAEVFECLPELEVWHHKVPCIPELSLDQCADVVWGFVVEVRSATLHIYDNRNARFRWSALQAAGAPFATLSLDALRALQVSDIHSLQRILLLHAYADGLDPTLPLSDGISAQADGPDNWSSRLQIESGHASLTLVRPNAQVIVRRVLELTLDDARFGAFLRASLPPGLLAMSRSIYGPSATLQQVGRLASHLPQLPFSAEAGGLPLLVLGLNPGADLPLKPGPQYFEELRSLLISAGLALGGWRFLIRQDNAVLRALLQYFPPSARILGDFCQFVDHFANALQGGSLPVARCQAGLRGVDRILDRTRGRPGPLRRQNAEIYLRALVRAELSDDEEANLGHEAQDIADYVYQTSTLLKGATWRSLQRRSDHWHRSIIIHVDPDRDLRWTALLPNFEADGYTAQELNTGRLLAEEGLEQKHCIGTYVNACVSGSTRVFSIRQNQRRVATLELQRTSDGRWTPVQLRGKANSLVTDRRLIAFAQSLAPLYDAAAKQAESPRRFTLDQPPTVLPYPDHCLGASNPQPA